MSEKRGGEISKQTLQTLQRRRGGEAERRRGGEAENSNPTQNFVYPSPRNSYVDHIQRFRP
ncbi:MAG: hypothetical protein F6K58_12070 [Symploca sp. SIO2E9]|nr:hypothetical protein [Symploca sp. SIO2E9]